MKCPKCDSALRTAKHSDVTIDFCELCYGIWLDKGELERIAAYEKKDAAKAVETLKNLLKAENEIVQEQSICCPHCEQQMQKIKFTTKDGIVADKCAGCQGIWFDKGELISITDHMDGKKNSNPGQSRDVSLLPSILALGGIIALFILLLIWAISYFK
ncbi:MAG: zf-TFIIB domain-containing protein [Candidatus Omnitrophota bacterium]